MAKKTEIDADKLNIDTFKEEINDYISLQVKKQLDNELDKTTRRLIREKNRQILTRNVIILVLIALIVLGVYFLYNDKYFDKFFNTNNTSAETNKSSEPKKEEEQKQDTKNKELYDKYAVILDKYKMNENSKYLSEFYNGNLTEEIKKYITVNNIDGIFNSEDEEVIIEEDKIKSKYQELFTSEYSSGEFYYNNNKIKYYAKFNSYMSEKKLEKKESNIKKEIIDIKENFDEVIVQTVEGIINNNKLYNIVNTNEVKKYKSDSLANYRNSLNVLTYTFKGDKLISIKQG